MKKREIRTWMAAAGLAMGMALTACGTDSVNAGAESAVETAEQESATETAGTAQDILQETKEEETGAETLQQKETDSSDDAVLLEEGQLEDGTYEGIVVDASMNNFAIRTEEGKTCFMERPEDGGSLKEGLLLGIPVKVVIKNQVVTELTDGEKQPESDQETLNFAISVMDAFRYGDMNALTTLMKYPAAIVLEGDMVYKVEDAEQVEEIGADRIFTKELKKAVSATNLYELKALEDGTYVMGQADGGCKVIFEADQDNDRGYSIRSIEGPAEEHAAG